MSAARRYEQSRAPLHRQAQFRSTAGLAAAAATQRPLRPSGRPGRSDVRALAASNFLSAAQDRVPEVGRQAVHAAMVKSAFWKPARAILPSVISAPSLGRIGLDYWHFPRPHDGNHLVHDGIVAVTAACDRLHRSRVEPAVLNETIIDVNPDHLPEGHVTVSRLAIEIVEFDDLEKLAFERARRRSNAGRAYQARGRWRKAGLLHFIDAAGERDPG